MLGFIALALILWVAVENRRFEGPPTGERIASAQRSSQPQRRRSAKKADHSSKIVKGRGRTPAFCHLHATSLSTLAPRLSPRYNPPSFARMLGAAMPKRTDIKSIMIIGAGPIVIGQACEFDYSGAQACKALREEGYRVILVNSNPATIMTDPGLADATYIEPITPEVVAKIIEKERPDALLPTMGGQTGLNTALALADMGVLDKFDVELIGAKREAIEMAEDRKLFREAMDRIGLENPKATIIAAPKLPSGKYDIAAGVAEAMAAIEYVGLPAIIRPAFTLGGTGGGVAYNRDDYEAIVRSGLEASPVAQVLVDESLLGWKEFEMEVVRDTADNAIIVCAIENVDPMGVHTGDSITVAPALTLTDKEYQIMRNGSHCRAARDRRRNRRLQRAMGDQPRRWPHGGDRDEPARVAVLGAGVEGHRLSHRQDRGQTGRRLHAGRAGQRHHQGHARLV